jgi:hypothetical protein
MECPRCKGMMVAEDLQDYESTYLSCTAWRCLMCGEIVDQTILRHRTPQATSTDKSLR